MPNTDSIVFNGIRFTRYPDAKQWAHRMYYSPNGTHRKAGVGTLHQEIWRAAHGPIPEGHEIHHVDSNPLNNDLANLACITAEAHLELHKRLSEHERQRRAANVVANALPASKPWHASPEGRAWHSENIKRTWESVQERQGVCEQCRQPYTVKLMGNHDRFCSNACKSRHRRASGVDNETRICVHCGGDFMVNKYKKTRTCSRHCSFMARKLDFV